MHDTAVRLRVRRIRLSLAFSHDFMPGRQIDLVLAWQFYSLPGGGR